MVERVCVICEKKFNATNSAITCNKKCAKENKKRKDRAYMKKRYKWDTALRKRLTDYKRHRYNTNEKFRQSCLASNKRYRRKHPHRAWARSTLTGHKKSGYKIELSIYALEEMVKKITYCWICGVKLTYSYPKGKNTGGGMFHPSLDRIYNEDFISKDNVQIICYRCNVAKNRMSMKEFIEYCKIVAERNSNLLE